MHNLGSFFSSSASSSASLRLRVNLIALTPENATKDAQLGFVFLLLYVFLGVSA